MKTWSWVFFPWTCQRTPLAGVFAGISLAADVLFHMNVSAEECLLVLLVCTFRRWDSSAQIKWECYPQLRDCLPGRLYCLWTVGRWTAPELMSLAKGGSENMHTCCSRSNKTPTAWYRRENITAEATSDHIWKFFSVYFDGQQFETRVDHPEYQTVCSCRRFLKENSTNFRREDQFTRCENSCIMSAEALDAWNTIWKYRNLHILPRMGVWWSSCIAGSVGASFWVDTTVKI